MQYDVAVAGLGGMGSAILAHCGARGAAVIGLEQFPPEHGLGASSGKSRIIRQAYFENPAYVPMLLRAYELWRDLEQETGEEILQTTGLVTVGSEVTPIIAGTCRAAIEYGLSVVTLSERELTARFPTLKLLAGEIAIFEAAAGVLNPERAIRAHLTMAAAQGAKILFGAQMKSWDASKGGVTISLADGTVIFARKLVLALGPWFKQTLETLGVPIRVQRNVQAWFLPATDSYNSDRFPAFLLDRIGLPAPLYGFPDFGDGVKAAFHGFGQLTDADHVERSVDFERDIEPLARALEQWMPGSTKTFRDAKPCMYTLTPDEHFVIDQHPEHANVILCGGFSGHGFKFVPVVGEIGAALALDGGPRSGMEFLSLARFRR